MHGVNTVYHKTLTVEKSNKFDEWRVICQSFPFQYFSYEGYNQFVKVLLVKVSDMLNSSNFVRLFHHQSFALYGIILTLAVCNEI